MSELLLLLYYHTNSGLHIYAVGDDDENDDEDDDEDGDKEVDKDGNEDDDEDGGDDDEDLVLSLASKSRHFLFLLLAHHEQAIPITCTF